MSLILLVAAAAAVALEEFQDGAKDEDMSYPVEAMLAKEEPPVSVVRSDDVVVASTGTDGGGIHDWDAILLLSYPYEDGADAG